VVAPGGQPAIKTGKGVRLPIDRLCLVSACIRRSTSAHGSQSVPAPILGCCAATLLETEFRRKQIDYNAAILAKDSERTIR